MCFFTTIKNRQKINFQKEKKYVWIPHVATSWSTFNSSGIKQIPDEILHIYKVKKFLGKKNVFFQDQAIIKIPKLSPVTMPLMSQ